MIRYYQPNGTYLSVIRLLRFGITSLLLGTLCEIEFQNPHLKVIGRIFLENLPPGIF